MNYVHGPGLKFNIGEVYKRPWWEKANKPLMSDKPGWYKISLSSTKDSGDGGGSSHVVDVILPLVRLGEGVGSRSGYTISETDTIVGMEGDIHAGGDADGNVKGNAVAGQRSSISKTDRWGRYGLAQLMVEEGRIANALAEPEFESVLEAVKRYLLGVVGMHVGVSINEGRHDGFLEVGDRIGAYQWSALLDTKTCKLCKYELDGRYFDPDDRLLNLIWPEIHLHCRCIMVGVLKEELRTYSVPITTLTLPLVAEWTRYKFWAA
jgi:SPP1 gp7 family putative phage head morphogenesis protein